MEEMTLRHEQPLISEALHSDMTESEFLDAIGKNMLPLEQFIMYYKCAIMEVETKFKVLNEQFSLKARAIPSSSYSRG